MQRHRVPRAKGGARSLREKEAYGKPQIPGCQGAANGVGGARFVGGASGGPALGSGRGSQELGGARRVVAAQRRQ